MIMENSPNPLPRDNESEEDLPIENKRICPHKSCIISSLRGLRNGIYYGGRIRLMHSLVMAILYRTGSTKSIILEVITNTYRHAKSLGLYVFFYKSLVCILNKIRKKRSKTHSLISGFVIGFCIFGLNKNSINYQIILYLLSRVIVGGVQRFAKKKKIGKISICKERNFQWFF